MNDWNERNGLEIKLKLISGSRNKSVRLEIFVGDEGWRSGSRDRG